MNVFWAWAPNGSDSLGTYEPDNYDVVSPSPFDFDGRASVKNSVMRHVCIIATFTEKLILIGQTGTCAQGDDKSRWVEELISKVAENPSIIGFLYFNYYESSEGECNWKIWENDNVISDWRLALAQTDIVYAEDLKRQPHRYSHGWLLVR